MITQKELARLLNLSVRTIIRMRHTGKIPVEAGLCRKVLWDQSIIEAWVSSGCPCRSKWERQQKGH